MQLSFIVLNAIHTMTKIIVALTVIVSLIGFTNHRLNSQLIFNPYVTRVRKEWYRFFSCSLLHADFLHLGVNMWVLFSFGQSLEYYYAAYFSSKASFMFILLYVSSVVAANISTYIKHNNNPSYNSLGASGGVSAIVFASILFDPLTKIILFPIPFPIPLIVFGIGYLIYSWWMGKRSTGDNINHEAHFYGSVQGIVFTLVFKPEIGRDFLVHLGILQSP